MDRVVVVPAGVANEGAAQATINPLTAWFLTMLEHRMQPGEWLAQTAAGSTVGKLVLQLARSEGFKTINMVRRRAQISDISQLGGDVTICIEDADWIGQVKEAASPSGISKAIDCVAGRVGVDLAKALTPGGKSVIYGSLSSHRQTDPAAFETPLFTPKLIYAATTVRGRFLFGWLAKNPATEAAVLIEGLLKRMADGSIKLPHARKFRPEQYQMR